MQQIRPALVALGALTLALVPGCRFVFDESTPFAQPLDSSVVEQSPVYYDGVSRLTMAPQQAILVKSLPMTLSLDQLSLTRIKTKLTLAVQGYTGRRSDLLWGTSHPQIAVVNDLGEVTPADGSETGEVVISVASKDDPTQRAMAKVKVIYLDTLVQLLYSTTTVRLSETRTLKLNSLVTYSDPTQRDRVIGTDSTGKAVSWSSSDMGMAQVNDLGEVTILEDAATGSVTITAKSHYDPTKSAAVTLKIVD